MVIIKTSFVKGMAASQRSNRLDRRFVDWLRAERSVLSWGRDNRNSGFPAWGKIAKAIRAGERDVLRQCG